jgi:hypothetical protein
MATPIVASGQQYSVGLRYATVFKLDSNGYPLAGGVATIPTEGYEFYGANAWELVIPDVRRINHAGNDRLMAMDFLPPIEGASATLQGSAQDEILDAMLTGVNTFHVGYMELLPVMTEQQGSEPDVALFLFQQSLDRATKLRHYRFHIVPKARCTPLRAGMTDAPSVSRYSAIFNPTTKHLWGKSLDITVEGCTEMAMAEGMSQGRPKIVAWLADGAETEFLYPTDKPAVGTDYITAWVNSVYQIGNPNLTTSVTKLTFAVPPTTGQVIVSMYEY